MARPRKDPTREHDGAIITRQTQEIIGLTADNARLVESRDGYMRQLNVARDDMEKMKKEIASLKEDQFAMVRLQGYQQRIQESDRLAVDLEHAPSVRAPVWPQ